MKKVLLSISLLIISSCFIQLYSQSISIGIKGGVSFSNMLEESDLAEFSQDYKFIPGYNLGIFAEAEASPGVIGEAGIGLATFGYNLESEGTMASIKAEAKANYLMIPLKAKTVHELGFIDVFASGGVYAAYGLSGTYKAEITINDVTDKTNEEIKWGNDPDEDDMVRLDYGVVGSVGAVIKGIVLELGYYHGLANLAAYTDENYVISNRAFTISLGYKYDF